MSAYNVYHNWAATPQDVMMMEGTVEDNSCLDRLEEYAPQTDGLRLHERILPNDSIGKCASDKTVAEVPVDSETLSLAACKSKCEEEYSCDDGSDSCCIGVTHTSDNTCTFIGPNIIENNPGYIGGEHRTGATTYLQSSSDKVCGGIHSTNHWDVRDCDESGQTSNAKLIKSLQPFAIVNQGHGYLPTNVRPR